MSVYTRTGDKGKTSLYQGKRVWKSSPRIEAIGSVDELNSLVGVVLAQIKSSKFGVQSSELVRIQNDLFEIGAKLANPSSKLINLENRVKDFEKIIDELTGKLPQLNNFILPGGSLTGSHLHLARTVSRRAERRIVELSQQEKVQPEIITYINRLSDLLFMFARYINYSEKKKEIAWKSR